MGHEAAPSDTIRVGWPGLDRGQWIVIVGLVCNTVLAGVQIFAGHCGHSRAVLADGIHSSSDILISLLVLASLRIANRPADRSHPFGHGKAESIAAFVVGLIIAVAGLTIVYDVTVSAIGGTETVPGMLALFVGCGSILAKGALYRITIGIGRQLNSPGVLAAALEYRSCMAISSAAVIGVIGARMGFAVADPLAGLVVAGFVLKVAGETIWTSTNELMDSALPAERVEAIRAAALGIDGVRDVPAVRTRRMGSKRLVGIEISTAPDMVMEEVDRVAVRVRKRITEELAEAEQVRVFVSSEGQAEVPRKEMEDGVRRAIERHAPRFLSYEGLRITRLGRDVCADFSIVLPRTGKVEDAYALCADLDREIKIVFPDIEVVIRLGVQESPQVQAVPSRVETGVSR